MAQRYENHEITLAESAKQASTDLKVDSNAEKGWVEVKPNESENAIYVTYKDSKLLEGKKSSQAGKAIFKINLSDGSITPNPDLKDPDPTPSQGSSLTLDMVASDITSTTITVTVTPSGNGIADNPEYTYYLNVEQKGDPTNSNTYTYTDLTPDTTYTLKVSTKDKDGNNVETKITSTTSKEETSDTVETHIADIQVGDYVNYTAPTASYLVASANTGYSSDQSFNSTNCAMNLWRVWKVDKTNNKIEMVSSDGTEKRLYLSGATGYNQGPGIMNNICSAIYSDSSKEITARSLDGLDLEYAMAENWGIARGTNEFASKLNSCSSAYPGRYNSTFSTESAYIPKCYTSEDIQSEQSNDLRPGSSSATGYKKRSKLTYKYTYYCLDGSWSNETGLADALGARKFLMYTKKYGGRYFIASRCVCNDYNKRFASFAIYMFCGNLALDRYI